MHTYIHIYILCPHTGLFISPHTGLFVYTRIHTCSYIYRCVHTYICVHIYRRVHIYLYTLFTLVFSSILAYIYALKYIHVYKPIISLPTQAPSILRSLCHRKVPETVDDLHRYVYLFIELRAMYIYS